VCGFVGGGGWIGGGGGGGGGGSMKVFTVEVKAVYASVLGIKNHIFLQYEENEKKSILFLKSKKKKTMKSGVSDRL